MFILLLLPLFCTRLFLLHQILVADCYQSGPSSRSLLLKRNQCSTFPNARKFQSRLLRLQPHLLTANSSHDSPTHRGQSTGKDGRAASHHGCSIGMGVAQAGNPASPRAWWRLPHSTSHPWKATYKANSKIMPTITGGISIIPQKYSRSNLFV